MKISEDMISLIRDTRTRKLSVWKDSVNELRIGHYHRVYAKNNDIELVSTKSLTKIDCEKLFLKDIDRVQRIANVLLKGETNVPQNHYDVFCSLLFDFEKRYILNSTFYRLYKQGLRAEASGRILVWGNKKGTPIKYLKDRRTLDKQIYDFNDYTKLNSKPKSNKRAVTITRG